MYMAYDIAEIDLGETHHFKDESKLGLRGQYFVGMFQRGLPKYHGVGRIVTEDNSLYEGMIAEGHACGFGRLILATGVHFVGYFRDGKMNGLAAKYNADNAFLAADTYIDG